MTPAIRKSLIYSLIILAGLVLASRLVTVAFMLVYAPEDAAPFFYLKQAAYSAICVGLIAWLWSKRAGPA